MPLNPVNSNQVTIAATPTLIASFNGGRSQLSLNNAGGATVFVGGPNVTTLTGMAVANNVTTQFNTPAALYGVVASGTNVVSFLEA